MNTPAIPMAVLVAAPELLAAVEAGQRMRAAQVAYFKTRTKEALIASKQAEKEFDAAATAAITHITRGTA